MSAGATMSEPATAAGGVPLTDAMIERMADEAERGYDPEQLSPVPCVNCGDPIEFVPYDTGNGGEWRHVGATVSAAYCLAKRENAPVTLASPRDNG